MLNPPNACPKIEPVSQVAELIAAADGSNFLGTIFDINAEKVGPEKALIIPVNAMTVKINDAIDQGCICFILDSSDKKRKNKMQLIYKITHFSNKDLFSFLSI